MIITSGIKKYYGETAVVDDVSIELPARGITSIIGPNGAGKSTMLSIVSRLLGMDAGSVTVDGLDVSNTPSDVLARRLSILRQDNHMTARLTVADLVAFGRYPYSKGRLTIEDKAHIDQSIAYLNLDDLRDRFLDELSGGQRQRAFVAMVLCQDTDYVLLDEPLNNLDMKHAMGMMKLMQRACHELGKTVVLVLHDINFASWYSDYIIAMKNGRVIRHGTKNDIITPEALKDIYDMDINVHEIGGHRVSLFYD
ncbi:ABC transporter ATP-binding protein [Pelagibacterium halotolerans]|uniref:Iron(III) dicitrate transport ATP-binding protein FecE n=1 Tax=Pelagibacterium halotolerans (strain DSM 22347 / JCM 15775 / CGMCC 1.7692 / B2) TaxID=1082931 RepID=G4R6H7_PELHB|nr:ABC transporter ATP-binding protein [Pelagibacterium halotolerans]AEQ51173.1 iron(III) dicitrate transport ATP-binding protein FecE [Pelagibacterium halotolerans B2]QJR18960.1 ABC transporter ATP-binding protein [Pelagibacterium halotolerans]SEA69089.1 iron complex transport system ATP-binding protein [Pelagibacterium halotolerans]